MMYRLINTYNNETILQTDNKQDVIKRLKELEIKDYHNYLDYCQRCVDNFEDPLIDEKPGDYYNTYYIITNTHKIYNIINYNLLERSD